MKKKIKKKYAGSHSARIHNIGLGVGGSRFAVIILLGVFERATLCAAAAAAAI